MTTQRRDRAFDSQTDEASCGRRFVLAPRGGA